MSVQGTTGQDSDAVASSVNEELLRHLARQSAWVPLPVFVGALLIFSIAYDTSPRRWLIACRYDALHRGN